MSNPLARVMQNCTGCMLRTRSVVRRLPGERRRLAGRFGAGCPRKADPPICTLSLETQKRLTVSARILEIYFKVAGAWYLAPDPPRSFE